MLQNKVHFKNLTCLPIFWTLKNHLSQLTFFENQVTKKHMFGHNFW